MRGLSILAALLLAPSASSAAPSAAEVRQAQALTKEATRAFKAGRHSEAADKFEAAHQLVPNAILLKNAVKAVALHIGDCPRVHRLADAYLATGPTKLRAHEVATYKADCHIRAAEAHLEARRFTAARGETDRALALDLPATVRARVEAATRRIDAAERAHAKVQVKVLVRDPEGAPVKAQLRLDEVAVTLDAEAQLHLSPGPHSLRVEAEGFEAAERVFTAAPGFTVEVTLERVVVTPPVQVPAPADEGRARRIAGYGTLGLAGVAAIAALAFDVSGQSSADELREVGAEGRDRARYDTLTDEVETAKYASGGLYLGALVAGVAGGLLLYWGQPAEAPVVSVGPGGLGVSLSW